MTLSMSIDCAAWHVKAAVERVWMDGESLSATTDRKINHTDELKGFGRGKSAPLVISSLEIPTPGDKRGDKSDYFCSPGSKLGFVGATASGL
jgi:hypothetical protein